MLGYLLAVEINPFLEQNLRVYLFAIIGGFEKPGMIKNIKGNSERNEVIPVMQLSCFPFCKNVLSPSLLLVLILLAKCGGS